MLYLKITSNIEGEIVKPTCQNLVRQIISHTNLYFEILLSLTGGDLAIEEDRRRQ